MDEFYLYVSSEDSLSLFENNNGGASRIQLHKSYTLDGEWECALLELSFFPKFPIPTRRIFFCSDFVIDTYAREMSLPILQSAGVLNEDIADIVYKKPIYLKVTTNELYQIKFVLRDDNLKRRQADPFGFLLVDLKPGTAESSRLRNDVLQTGNGVDTSEELEGNHSSDSSRLQTDVLQTGKLKESTPEEMEDHDSSDTESTTSDIMDDREDLIACRDCGLVFAHYRGLGNHNCRTKSIRLPMSGEALEGILSGTSTTVCCADDLPAYVCCIDTGEGPVAAAATQKIRIPLSEEGTTAAEEIQYFPLKEGTSAAVAAVVAAAAAVHVCFTYVF
ncbi:unnamed protein product [Mytilus coruscus]|uniref:Uncharacterized protein n=1 Tax=Mytilus coruscus TaxID=42192 RepID=A0A6J8CW04_MYTCO|nr:unnamed protein product [Mytilus coruscus]